jgi:16S rRNA (guanine527-N7)-methyltransferase
MAVQAEAPGSTPAVSRETRERLEVYVDLLQRWQRRINLVSPSTLPHIWERHITDSLQLVPLIPNHARVVLDLGSGAGFPGLVLAIAMPWLTVHLVESDGRKAAFLTEAARLTRCAAKVHARRVEALDPAALTWDGECLSSPLSSNAPRTPVNGMSPSGIADVVTARALAPLNILLNLASRFLGPGSICLFPKGRQVEDELTDAARCWKMELDQIQSVTESSATILRVGGLGRV